MNIMDFNVKKLAADAGTFLSRAVQVIGDLYSQFDGSEIVLLTNGEDNTANSCTDEVKQSGSIVHFITLGKDADEAVIAMSNVTGGSHFYASDEAQNNDLIDAFGALTSGNADISRSPFSWKVRD
ncbi:calcium-activated chloride channel regulator 4-like [Saimiri boliviensis]|uniref:calcium-activated chloride channel regulator 4-like n=1 Tax=Saimiri boliviensis TaxID=27679 RepID=UPI00193CD099|nr:calcium-activated chloride channel regulator 4-like [Saimiri boliviensis boliviensis]